VGAVERVHITQNVLMVRSKEYIIRTIHMLYYCPLSTAPLKEGNSQLAWLGLIIWKLASVQSQAYRQCSVRVGRGGG
jgi:hypothetical protein